MKSAAAYYRTSSQTNVGSEKDSLKRQEEAVRAYAHTHDITVVREFYDAAVSGADPVDSRPGFSEMIAYMLGNGARAVLVETANRFARDLIVQETGYKLLKDKGIELIAVDSPESFVSDTPTAEFIRQVLGAVAQLEKAMLVSKLRGARDRQRRDKGRCEGNPAFGIIPQAHITAAKTFRAKGASLRSISNQLAVKGYLSRTGTPYGASAIRSMLMKPQLMV
jgi:DNA invertase Pin-like site-specific DNA recombinase